MLKLCRVMESEIMKEVGAAMQQLFFHIFEHLSEFGRDTPHPVYLAQIVLSLSKIYSLQFFRS